MNQNHPKTNSKLVRLDAEQIDLIYDMMNSIMTNIASTAATTKTEKHANFDSKIYSLALSVAMAFEFPTVEPNN